MLLHHLLLVTCDVIGSLLPLYHLSLCFFVRLHLHFDLVDIIFEVAFFHGAVGERHLAVAVLDAPVPLALVPTAIRPAHLTITVAVVLEILTLVLVAASPDEATEAMLAVVLVLTVVDVAGRALGTAPLALAVLHACLEKTDVGCSVCPRILAFSLGLAVQVIACVRVSVDKEVGARAVLYTLVPFAFITVSVLPGVHAVAVRLALVPLANVRVVEEAAPDAVAGFEPHVPLAVVDFAIEPRVHAFAMSFAHLEVAVVAVSVRIPFKALSVAQIAVPAALVLPPVRILHHALAMALALDHDAEEDGLGEAPLAEAFLGLQFFQVDLVGLEHHFVKFERDVGLLLLNLLRTATALRRALLGTCHAWIHSATLVVFFLAEVCRVLLQHAVSLRAGLVQAATNDGGFGGASLRHARLHAAAAFLHGHGDGRILLFGGEYSRAAALRNYYQIVHADRVTRLELLPLRGLCIASS